MLFCNNKPSLPRMRESRLSKKTLDTRFRGYDVILFFCLLFLPLPTLAADPIPYAPDFCEFSVAFPEEPRITEHCETADQKKCYNLASYTKVFDLSATVNFRIICNPTPEKNYRDSTQEVMKMALAGMTRRKIVKPVNTSYREDNGYKQAGLVGEGTVGRMPEIYIAQMWVGRKSVLLVEAELIGEAHPEADKLYSEILKTIHYTGGQAQKAQGDTKKKDTKK